MRDFRAWVQRRVGEAAEDTGSGAASSDHSAPLPFHEAGNASGSDQSFIQKYGFDFPAATGERHGFVPPPPRPRGENRTGTGERRAEERVKTPTAPALVCKRQQSRQQRQQQWKKTREESSQHTGRRGAGSEKRRGERRRQDRCWQLLCAAQRARIRTETVQDIRQARGMLAGWKENATVQQNTGETNDTELQRRREEQLQQTHAKLKDLQAEIEEHAQRLLIYESAQAATDDNRGAQNNRRETQIGRLYNMVEKKAERETETQKTAARLAVYRWRLGYHCDTHFDDHIKHVLQQAGRVNMSVPKQTTVGLLAAVAHGGRGLSPFRTVPHGGYDLHNYSNATVEDFADDERWNPTQDQELQEARAYVYRTECRGLVTQGGTVVARPLHKFWTIKQLQRNAFLNLSHKQLRQLVIIEATEKMDGAMVYAVPTSTGFQLWTRAGYTHHGNIATQWASQQGASGDMDFNGLFTSCENFGATPVFEWIGKHVGGKVASTQSRLVLIQVRDKVSGEYWDWEDRRDIAQRYNVECVRLQNSFAGRTIAQVQDQVRKMRDIEGFVLRTDSGLVVKLKTKWWDAAAPVIYQKWPTMAQRSAATTREAKKLQMMDVQALRAQVKHWPGDKSPSLTLQHFRGAQKVEAFYSRVDGKRGAIIVSFTNEATAATARRTADEDGNIKLVPAYGCRASSSGRHRVRTWYRKPSTQPRHAAETKTRETRGTQTRGTG